MKFYLVMFFLGLALSVCIKNEATITCCYPNGKRYTISGNPTKAGNPCGQNTRC